MVHVHFAKQDNNSEESDYVPSAKGDKEEIEHCEEKCVDMHFASPFHRPSYPHFRYFKLFVNKRHKNMVGVLRAGTVRQMREEDAKRRKTEEGDQVSAAGTLTTHEIGCNSRRLPV